MSDRFDLEQKILDCWGIISDLKLYTEHYDTLTEDQKLNILIGIQDLYDLKFHDTFETFCSLIRERKI